jgi:hypothetical protein
VQEAVRRVGRLGDGGWGYFGRSFPTDVAIAVMQSASKYPLWIVQSAEQALRPHTTSNATVGAIAKRDKWFAG